MVVVVVIVVVMVVMMVVTTDNCRQCIDTIKLFLCHLGIYLKELLSLYNLILT